MGASSGSFEQNMDLKYVDTLKSKITDLFELKNKEIFQLKSDHFIQDDSDSDDEDEFYIGQKVWMRDNDAESNRWGGWSSGYVRNLDPLRVSSHKDDGYPARKWDQVRLPKFYFEDDLDGIHLYLRLIGRQFEKKERKVNDLKQEVDCLKRGMVDATRKVNDLGQEVHRLKQEVQANIDLAEEQGNTAMILQSQKMILQEFDQVQLV